MQLTKDDLYAIEQIFDKKIDILAQGIETLGHKIENLELRMDRLEQRMDCLEQRMDSLEQRVDNLEQRMDSLEKSVTKLEQRMDSLEQRVDRLEHRMDSLEHEIKYIKVDLIENNVLPRLSTIESCYTSTYDRYKEDSEKISNTYDDIVVMKMAIRKNSEDIQTLMLKQA